MGETECAACAEAQENGGDMCREHAEEALLDEIAAKAEARGYARGELSGYHRCATEILGPAEVQAMMLRYDAAGYARGVEDATKIVETVHECDMGGYHWLATKVRALLKPKGEAK